MRNKRNKITRQEEVEEIDGSSSMQFLKLSIFILLLAFFVILNTHSKFNNDRATFVIDSLGRQFATDEDPNKDNSDKINTGSGETGGSYMEKLYSMFTSMSFSFELNKIDGEGEFFIKLRKKDFDKALSQAIKGQIIMGKAKPGRVYERYTKLFTQISVMTMPKDGILSYRLSVLIHTPDTGRVTGKNIEDLISYKEQLKKLGIYGKTVSFGLKSEADEYIELYFVQ